MQDNLHSSVIQVGRLAYRKSHRICCCTSSALYAGKPASNFPRRLRNTLTRVNRKAVMISHLNVIANTMQYAIHETYGRNVFGVDTQSVLGLLPFSHIYGLVVVAHGNVWRGDEVVVLPKFDMSTFLTAIERFKLNHLYLVCQEFYARTFP